MTVLCWAKLPESIDICEIGRKVRLAFPNPQNQEYINDIEARGHADSVAQSLCALLLLSEAFKELEGQISELLVLKRAENGKPYLENSSLCFSISHSHKYVVCALSDESDLGVDVETSPVADEKAKKLAERFFNEEEKLRVTDNPQVFNRIWSEKEATAKFLGIPLGEYLAQARGSVPVSDKLSSTELICVDVDKTSVIVCKENGDGEIKLINKKL